MKTATPEPTTGLPTGFDDPESFFYVPENRRADWSRYAPDAPMAGVYAIARNIAILDEWADERASRAAAREADRKSKRTRAVSAEVRNRLDALFATGQQAAHPTANASEEANEPTLERLESLAHTTKPLTAAIDFDDRVTLRLDAALAVYTAKAEHVCRALHVLTQLRSDETRQARAELIRKHWECPVCGDSSGGAPVERALAPAAQPRLNVPRPDSATAEIPTIVCCAKCFIVAQAIYLASVRTEVVKAPTTTREALVRAGLSSS